MKSFVREPLVAACATQDGAYLTCWNITANFLHFCNTMGLGDTALVYVKGFLPQQQSYQLGRSRWPFAGTPDSHYLARVGTHYYDWTYRQFDPRGPFPFIFESERDLAIIWKFRRSLKFLQATAIFRGEGAFNITRGLNLEQWTLTEVYDENNPRCHMIGPFKFQSTFADLRFGTTGRLARLKDVPLRASQIRGREALLIAPHDNSELIQLLTQTDIIEPTRRHLSAWGALTPIHRIITPVKHLPYSNVPDSARAQPASPPPGGPRLVDGEGIVFC